MSETTEQPIVPPPTDEATELATLRRVNAELLQKSATRKTKIADLETRNSELEAKLSEAHGALRQVTVEGPLKAMAESISISGDLWLEQFSKAYRLEMVKGQLTLQTADGKAVLNGEKPVPFERQALVDLLTNDTHPQAKIFKSILIASRASGGAHAGGNRSNAVSQTPNPIHFGLR